METVVLFHTHGLDRFDFSDLTGRDLLSLNEIAARRDVLLCPTVYIIEEKLSEF